MFFALSLEDTGEFSDNQNFHIFLQVRSKITSFGGFGGPTETTCGGNALKFYASVRLNIRRLAFVKKGEEVQISLVCFSCFLVLLPEVSVLIKQHFYIFLFCRLQGLK